jgi:hypothetical protein
LTAIPWSDQNLWAFEPLHKSGATRPHHHQAWIPHPLYEKGIRKLQLEFDQDPTVASKVMAISNRYSSVARPDLIITEYGFLIHPMEKGIRILQ